jgi:hypothetical protein
MINSVSFKSYFLLIFIEYSRNKLKYILITSYLKMINKK